MSSRISSVASAASAVALSLALTSAVNAAFPQYQVIDLSNVGQTNEKAVRAEGVSNDGHFVAGWTQQVTATGGVIGNRVWEASSPSGPPNILTSTAGRNFHFARSVNNSGVVAGFSATTAFFSSPLPVYWQSGTPTVLPLPAGETVGRANDINNSNTSCGSVNGGTLERATRFTLAGAEKLGSFADGGALMSAFGINDSGRIVGNSVDPNNAARNRGYAIDPGGNPIDLGALPGLNGSLPNDVNNPGAVVGSSMLNQGSGKAFYWTQAGGMVPITVPSNGDGIADALNDSGMVVGRDLNAVVGGNPTGTGFLWDGTQTVWL